jgi:copper chaperone CopZ
MSKTRVTSFSFVMVLLFILSSCGGSGGKKEVKEVPGETAMIEVSISGMTCTGCENTIQSGLTKVPGVISVKASHTLGNAIVEYNPEQVDTLKIKDAVNGCGYTAVKVMPHQEMTEN